MLARSGSPHLCAASAVGASSSQRKYDGSALSYVVRRSHVQPPPRHRLRRRPPSTPVSSSLVDGILRTSETTHTGARGIKHRDWTPPTTLEEAAVVATAAADAAAASVPGTNSNRSKEISYTPASLRQFYLHPPRCVFCSAASRRVLRTPRPFSPYVLISNGFHGSSFNSSAGKTWSPQGRPTEATHRRGTKATQLRQNEKMKNEEGGRHRREHRRAEGTPTHDRRGEPG